MNLDALGLNQKWGPGLKLIANRQFRSRHPPVWYSASVLTHRTPLKLLGRNDYTRGLVALVVAADDRLSASDARHKCVRHFRFIASLVDLNVASPTVERSASFFVNRLLII